LNDSNTNNTVILYGTLDIPALNETFIELQKRLSMSDSWVATDQKRIVGAVSWRLNGELREVERLMVAPDRRGESISTQLLMAVERSAIDAGYRSLQLTVGDVAIDNQRLYAHLGWQRVKSFHPSDYEHVLLHTMVKPIAAPTEV